jgi:hypothetical protein
MKGKETMKLNFWQWLAIVLLIIGLAIWIYEREHPTPSPTNPTGPAVTQPVLNR